MTGAGTAHLDVDALLADRSVRVLLCCGSGGVGKTTTAAALALRAAEAGRRVVVLTIDPARRLAQSLGLAELDNTPRPVEGIAAEEGGSLEAMMLDMKRTFDEVIEAHARPESVEQILANPFYVTVSSSFAGTQEYMAMEKLGQLRQQVESGQAPWDLVVVDTPPSRSALDFLDAPQRLGGFLDGRLIRILTTPAKVGGRASLRVLGAGVGVVTSVMSRLLGGDLLRDVATFVAALDTTFGGFRERAEVTYALLTQPETAFLVVTTPAPEAMAEATHLLERLTEEEMPVAGVVVNRVEPVVGSRLPAAAARHADALLGDAIDAGEAGAEDPGEVALTRAALQLQADRSALAERHREAVRAWRREHPQVAMTTAPTMTEDVHDLDGLRRVGAALAKR